MAMNRTEKQLLSMIGIQTRIEKLLENSLNKNGKKKGSNNDNSSNITTSVSSVNTLPIGKTLTNIETESKKTNILLNKLLKLDNAKSKDTSREIKSTAKDLGNFSNKISKLVKVVQIASKLPDVAIDKFKSILMVTVFIDPKTGKSFIKKSDIKRAEESSKILMNVLKGIALFGVALVAFSFALPFMLKGVAGFAIVLATISLSLFLTSKALQFGSGGLRDTSPIHSLKHLGMAVATFGLTMVAFGFAEPYIKAGMGVFVSVLAITISALFLLSLALNIGSGGLRNNSPLNSLKKLGMSVALFGLTMVAFGFAKEQIMGGMGIFIGVLSIVTLSIFLVHKILGSSNMIAPNSKNIDKQSGPLGSLMKLLFSVSLIALVSVAAYYVSKQMAIGSLVVSLSILVIGGAVMLLGKKEVEITRGSISLLRIGGVLAVFAVGMYIYSKSIDNMSWDKIGMLGAVIAGMSVIATVLGTPLLAKASALGSRSLILIGGALIPFAAALLIYSNAIENLTWEKIGMLGAVIAGMSVVATVLGIGPIPIMAIAGAAALIAIGGALLVFTKGLEIFAKSGFDNKDATNINAALLNVIAGFLGYEKMSDIGPLQIAKAGLLLPLIGAYSLMMLPLSLSLKQFSKGIVDYKGIGWNKDDSISLKESLSGVISAFTSLGEIKNARRLKNNIKSLADVGGTLSSMAMGIQSYANLTYPIYSYNEKTGKLEITDRIKLSSTDIVNAGISAGSVINSLTDPILNFGKSVFRNNKFFKTGINYMQSIGTGLSSIAVSVGDWANLTVTTWGIQKNKQTGLNELVPITKTKLEEGDIKQATNSIKNVLGALITPLSEFGEIFTTNKTVWYGTKSVLNTNLIEGIKQMASIGSGLSSIAVSVGDWANLTVTTWGIQKNKQTGLNEIVPIAKTKLDYKKDIPQATTNIKNVLGALISPLSEFGDMFTINKKVWYGTKLVSNEGLIEGINQLGNISNNMSSLAKGIGDWANMTYTEYEVKDGKLVPKDIRSLPDGFEIKAKENIIKILSLMADAILTYTDKFKNKDNTQISEAIEEIPKISKVISGIVNNISTLFGDVKINTITTNFKTFFDNLASTDISNFITNFSIEENKRNELSLSINTLSDFAKSMQTIWGDDKFIKSTKIFKNWIDNISDPIITKMSKTYGLMAETLAKLGRNFSFFVKPINSISFAKFTNDLSKLAKLATPFEKFANSFDKMSKSLGVFSNNFKIMSPKGIDAFTIWTDSLLKLIEAGKNQNRDNFKNAMHAANNTINTPFEYHKDVFNKDIKQSDIEKENAINEAINKNNNENTQKKENEKTMSVLLNAIRSLENSVYSLTSIMNRELNVNIASIDSNVSIKTKEIL